MEDMTGGCFDSPYPYALKHNPFAYYGQRAITALSSHRKRQLEARLKRGYEWQETGLVFTTTKGTPLDAQNVVNGSYKPLLKRAGLPPSASTTCGIAATPSSPNAASPSGTCNLSKSFRLPCLSRRCRVLPPG